MNTAVVHLAGTETISGAKTFSAPIIGSTTGNAAVACPDAYGAAGDGVTDDTAAVNAAIATGLDVWLTPGKTYLTWGGHVLGVGKSFLAMGPRSNGPTRSARHARRRLRAARIP